MKKKNDVRHLKRVETVQTLFEKGMRSGKRISKASTAYQVLQNKDRMDKLIKKNAPAWPLEQIAPIDLAILRLAIFELKFKNSNKEPFRVVIDEAIELAKEFGSENSPSFVNGVLGSILKS